MVTHTPYENESGMSNVPPETLRALRSFLWTHGITTTIAGLSEIIHDFGPHWAAVSEQIGKAVLMVPPTSIDDKAALLGVGKIRINYSDTGRKIAIIKVVRLALNMGLADAKTYVEQANASGVSGDFGVLDALNVRMNRHALPERFTME